MADTINAVLRFWVPVYVTITDGLVDEVHVDDGASARGYHDMQPDPDLIEEDEKLAKLAPDDALDRAIKAAFEDSDDWPSWEFGW